MADNEFMLKLVAMLDKAKSKRQVNSDIRELEKVVRNLRLTATLAKGESKKNINLTIKQLEGQLKKIRLQAKIDQKNLKSDIDKALQNISFKDLKDIDINIDSSKTKLKVQKVISDVKKTVKSNPISLNIDLKRDKLNNQLTTYVSKNSKIRESESLIKQVDSLRDKISGINDSDSLRNVTQEFQLFKSECAATGYQAKSATDKIRGLLSNVTKIGSTLGVASLAVSNFQKSLKTIRELDDILTEISKTSNSTKQELEVLGNSSFDTASKFGKVASDYLTAIQEFNRSGFYGEAGKALGELSLLTQAAGDVTAETAQNYLLATNAAYGYAGNVEKLTSVLDGQNFITNRHSVDMETMATATEKAGSMAANTGVKVEELSAMIGTISARTKEAGTITGTGIKALLVNLQSLSSDKIVGTLEKANASMTETVDGVEKLRTPIAILKDLAKTYNSLSENDPLKSEITTNIGGKHHANQLSALLSGWSDYERMLVDYSNGAGSALEEANKSANNLTGRLNALQNSWDELVNSITNKSAIKGGVSFLDTLLQSTTKLIEKFDVLPVAAAGITAFLTAKNKDYGISQVFNEDGKFDIQGNFMGIDISQIKHYREAEKAIAGWNKEVLKGKIDINDFNSEVVKNNASLRNYLSTCTDAPASLKGYKAHLQAAGEATNSLRLGTILLNTALSFGLGVAIKGVITGISKLSSASNDIAEKAKQIGEAYKSTQSEISDYKDKIEELHKTINSSSSSIEEVTAARQSLMTIQGEMIEKYGSEKEVIDMVTDAVNNQSDAFERLSEKKYQESINDFNKFDPWENIANFFSGYSDNMDRMVSEMEEPVILNLTSAANRNKEEYEKFEEIISQYGKIGTGKYGDGNGVDHFAIELSGGLEGVYDKLLKIQEAASGFDFGSSNFDKSLTSIINETKEKLDNYSDIYDNYILYEKILSKSGAKNGYDKSYENINNAMKKYTDAKLDGDKEKIRSAGEEYASILTEELSKISPDDEGVKNYLQNLYPEMQEIVGGWNLEYSLKENPENEKQLKAALSKFAGTNEIKQYDSGNSNDSTKNEAYAYLEGYADKYNLTFDQLIDKAQELGFVQDENYNELVNKFGEDNIKKLTPDELEIAYKIENVGDMTFKQLQNAIEQAKKEAVEIDIEALQKTYDAISEDITSLTTALSESVSGTGLSSDSVAAVNEMFGDLKGYDPEKLLDKTANGLRLNTRELEKLKKEYDDNTAKEFYKNVEDAYNSWQTALRNGEEQSVIDSLYDQYEQAAQLADQYVGLTSAYNQWQNALSTANEGDMYDSMLGQIKAMDKLWKEKRTNVDEFRAFADLISPKDLAGASQEEIEKAYQQSIGKIKRYFTEGQEGLERFLQDVNKVNSEWAHMNKDGSWEFNFGVGGDEKVAKAIGIDVEAVQAILRKMSEYSDKINIDYGLDSLAMMEKSADKAYNKLKKLGKIGKDIKIKFNTGDIDTVNKGLETAKDVLNKFRDKDGNVDLSIDGAAEAQTVLAKLLTEKQEIEKPAILKVDTKELSGKAASVVTMLQKIQQDINTYDVQFAIGADTTEAEKKIKEDIEAIRSNYGEELANVHINLDNIDSARKELTSLLPGDIEVIANAIVNHKEVDEYKKEKEEKKLKVITEVDDKAVNSFMNKTLETTIKAKVEVDDSELDKVNKKKSKSTDKKKTVESKENSKGKSGDKKAKADGTFNALKDTLASRGFANASGNISIPKDQTALVNELGEELIVRDGEWFTVKGGAQFTELKKGDIVFNHLQTRQLLKNGKITSSDNRGKFAHSDGTFGNAFSNGLFRVNKHKDTSTKKTSKKPSKSKKSSSNSSDKKESKQLIDWIARKLDVLQEKIDLTKAKFENLFTVKKQKNNLNNQIKQTTNLLNKEEKAATKYQKKANSIKLSDSLKKKVDNGKIKGSLSELIKEYGEKTAKQITKYQDYIDKVNEAKKAVAELKAEIKELTRQKLEVKLDDNDRKLTYQEAKYANAKTASAKNKILDKEINVYNSDYDAYKEYYKDAKKIRNKSGNKAKSAISKVKGLNKEDKKRIKKLIKQGKEIPSGLLKKVEKYNKSAYKKLLNYNKNVDFVGDALRDKNLAKEEKETNVREAKIEKQQNLADRAEAKYNLNKQYEANATSAKEKNKYETKSLKNLETEYKHLIEIAKLEGDTTEQKRLQAELDEKTAESYKTMYDNIKTEYENETGLNDANIAVVQAQIATLEAAGRTATKEMYDNMMKVSSDTKKKLLEERAKLEESGKNFAYGSQDWYEWQNDLLAIDQQLESCTQSTIEWQKAINELDLKKFSLITGQIESANNQIDFLVSMLSHKDLTSKETVGITDEGFTTISLWMDKMKNNNKIIENAQKAMAEYQKQIAEGTTGDDFETQNQKLQEYVETIRDAKLADEELKDSIVDLVEDAFKIQLDVLNDLIEKRKKALQTEKDLYDYQRKVASQTKTIASIQKQIAALTGDNSEEARARLQKLNVELDEAQQDLKDTEYDKWLSDQEDMLDGLADEMEDFFENMMHDTNAIIAAVEKAINENGAVIVNTLEGLGLGDSHSFDTKDNGDDTYTQDYMDYDGNKSSITYDKYGNPEKFTDKDGNVFNINYTTKDDTGGAPSSSGSSSSEKSIDYPKAISALENMKLPSILQPAKNTLVNTADSFLSTFTHYDDPMAASGGQHSEADKQSQIEQSLKKRKSLKNQSTSYINKYTTGEYGNVLNQYLANKDGKVYTSWANMKELADILGVKVAGDKVTSKEVKKIRDELKNAGFSQGGIVSAINDAVKQNGDDGIATVKKGEAVLTPKQTEAIQDMSRNLVKAESKLTPEQEEYIRQNIVFAHASADMIESMAKTAQKMETNNNNVQTTNVDVGGVDIHLDGSHVTDPDSFCDTFRKSIKMQKTIQAATIGQINKSYCNSLTI